MNAITIMAVANSIIAGCALGLAVYNAYATRRHNRLSVTPRITENTHFQVCDEGITVAYDLINVGLGPALITKVTLFINRKPFEPTDADPIEKWVRFHIGDRHNYTFKSQSFPGQRGAIRAGDKSRIAEVFFPGKGKDFKNIIQAEMKALGLRVEYKSFYGDRDFFDTKDW